MAGYSNDHFEMTADAVSRITTYFTFTKDMETSVTMGFKLTYENPSTDETEELYIEKTVPIETTRTSGITSATSTACSIWSPRPTAATTPRPMR